MHFLFYSGKHPADLYSRGIATSQQLEVSITITLSRIHANNLFDTQGLFLNEGYLLKRIKEVYLYGISIMKGPVVFHRRDGFIRSALCHSAANREYSFMTVNLGASVC